MTMHADLRVSFHDWYTRLGRGELADQVPEAESQDAAYARWQAKTGDPMVVERIEARYRNCLAQENVAMGRITARHKKSDLKKVREAYESLLIEQPDFANAACRLAYIWQIEGDPKRSLAAAVRASEADPLFEIAFFCAGICLKTLGRPDEAAAAYRKAVALNPRFAAAHDNLGLILIDKKDFDAAIEQFRAVLHDFPGAKNAETNLALAQRHETR